VILLDARAVILEEKGGAGSGSSADARGHLASVVPGDCGLFSWLAPLSRWHRPVPAAGLPAGAAILDPAPSAASIRWRP
jgi:hypothetical protein